MDAMDKQPTSFSIDIKLEQLMQCINTRYEVPVSAFWGTTGNEEADAASGAAAASSGVFDVLRHARNALEAGDTSVDRPYKCDLCAKRFAHPQTLDVHRRSHESGEPTATSSAAHAGAGGVVLPDGLGTHGLESKPALDCHGLETKPSLDCLRDSQQPQATSVPVRGQFSVGGFATMVFGSLQHRYNIAGVAALVSDEQPRRYCIRATAVLDSDAFARPCPVSGIITVAGTDGPSGNAGASGGTGDKRVRGSGERRFRCDICSKMFRRNDHMIRHRRALHGPPQTTERIFQCDICTKMFVRSDHLLRHRRTHRLSPTSAAVAPPATTVWPQAPKVEFAYDMFGRMLHVGSGEYFGGFVPPVSVHSVPNPPVERKPRTMREKRFRCFICAKMFTRKDHLVRHRHLVHRLPQHIAADLSPGADCRSLPLDFPLPPAGTDLQPPVPVPSTSSSSQQLLSSNSQQQQQQQQQQAPDFHQIPAQDFRLSPSAAGLESSGTAHRTDADAASGVDRNSSQYACAACGITYARAEHLRDHERRQHGALPCNVSMIQYSTERDPATARSDSAPRLRACDVCGISFAAESELREHMQRHVDSRAPATTDSLPVPLASGVGDHRRIDHNDRQCTSGTTVPVAGGRLFDTSNACHVCGVSFAVESELREHMQRHVDSRAPATTDSLPVPLASAVGDHRRIDHNDRQCTTGTTVPGPGGRLFDASNACQERVITAAPFPFDGSCSDTTLAHTCEVCGQRFAHRSQLQSHALTHAADRTFKCDLCDTSFFQADKLRDHNSRVHNKIDA